MGPELYFLIVFGNSGAAVVMPEKYTLEQCRALNVDHQSRCVQAPKYDCQIGLPHPQGVPNGHGGWAYHCHHSTGKN